MDVQSTIASYIAPRMQWDVVFYTTGSNGRLMFRCGCVHLSGKPSASDQTDALYSLAGLWLS